MDYYNLAPPALDGTPAQAFASHRTRASAIARQCASDHPLNIDPEAATEDNTFYLIAHLQAVLDDPEFSAGAEKSSTLVPQKLKKLNKGKHDGQVGTSDPDHNLFGDYDMALKGIMAIAYRYRSLLSEEDITFILDELVPPNLRGKHDPGIETKTATITEIPLVHPKVKIPETENHVLMIQSTKYLVNQLLQSRPGGDDEKYDNRRNGMLDWLLDHMQTLAQHDFLEFNSRPYQRLSLNSLLNLHEFAKDDEIKIGAQNVLDYVMVKFAVSSSRQRRVCPFRRLHENTNSPTKLNDLIEFRAGSESPDPLTGLFLMYAGPTDPQGKPLDKFPKCWWMEALIAGLATYRPPPAAYILSLQRDIPAYQHRFYHGARPELPEAGERGEGGLEIYYKSPSFLLTAGGMFLTSGYGGDEFTKYKQVAIAQATTLIPTWADVKFADLLRFERYPDDREAVNTGVHQGFACGANMHPIDRITIGETSHGAPALASHETQDRNALLLAWTGRGNGSLNCAKVLVADAIGMDRVDGIAEKVVLGDPAERGPALASHGGRLFLAWKGNGNDNLNVAFSEDNGATFHGKWISEETSHDSPALASHGGRLFLAWTGTGEGKLNVAKISFLGNTAGGFGIEGMTEKVVLDDPAEHAPALTSHGGRLFLAWKGNGNDNLNVAFSEDNGATFRGKWISEETSPNSPALASHGGRLFLAWTGTGEGNVNVGKVALIGNTAGGFGIEGLTEKIVLDDTAERAPALASHGNRLFLAWKGNGNDNLNVASSRDGAFRIGWQFLDLSPLGFYVALYRTPPERPQDLATPLESLGFLYAVEAGTMSFDTFRSRTLEQNTSFSGKLKWGGNYKFNSPDDHLFSFWLHPSQSKYGVRVVRAGETDLPNGFTDLPLVEGPYLRAPGGHDGLIEIRHPGCEGAPLILDFRNANHPLRQENIDTCPGPWLDRAKALGEVVRHLNHLRREGEAQAVLSDEIAVYRTLAGAGVGTAGTVPVTFDATRLFCRFFLIPGATPNWVNSRKQQTLWIAPGQYQFQVSANALTDFVFTITPDGAVDYDSTCDGFLSGRGTPSLRLDGLEVTLDASSLTGAADPGGGILLLMPQPNENWIQRQTARLLPQVGYAMQQGSGVICLPTFTLGRDGKFSYSPELDASNGGPLQGAGSNALEFKGHALRVDASKVSNVLLLLPVSGLPVSKDGKTEAVVLPADDFFLMLDNGVTDLGFSMDIAGNVALKPGMAGRLEVDPRGAGVPATVRVLSR